MKETNSMEQVNGRVLAQTLQEKVGERLDENWYNLTLQDINEDGIIMNLVVYNPADGNECLDVELAFDEESNMDELVEYIYNAVFTVTSLMFANGY